MPPPEHFSREWIQAEVDRLAPWYHSIRLPHEVTTPGKYDFPNWQLIREVRASIDYRGKNVLDLASMEGMWAFEAEELGAEQVIATDCCWSALPKFLFCRELRKSKVLPFYNVPVHELVNRLDVFLHGNHERWHPEDKHKVYDDPRFDIIQHFGLLYHLRDPMYSLAQCRSVISPGGILILETAICEMTRDGMMLFNHVGGEPRRIYQEASTWWAPNFACLSDMLWSSGFQPWEINHGDFNGDGIARACVVAHAIDGMTPAACELHDNSFRCPGLNLWKPL